MHSRVLESADLAHTEGFNASQKKHQTPSHHLSRKLDAPLGSSSDSLRQIATVLGFHHGSLLVPSKKALSGFTGGRKEILALLSGILRLAEALNRTPGKRIYRLEPKPAGDDLWSPRIPKAMRRRKSSQLHSICSNSAAVCRF